MDTIRKLCLAAALVAAAPGIASAGGQRTNDPRPAPTLAPAVKAASPTNAARLTALVFFGASGGDLLIRGKNVASVTNPSAGDYCITPTAAAGIKDPAKVVPVATVDWSDSAPSVGNGALVEYRPATLGCPDGAIEFYTFAQDSRTGRFVFSNGVSFAVVVP